MVTEQCCYWNITAPGNDSDCHVSHNGTALLTCEVYAPRNSNKNSMATVKWYRIIESVVEDITDSYCLSVPAVTAEQLQCDEN